MLWLTFISPQACKHKHKSCLHGTWPEMRPVVGVSIGLWCFAGSLKLNILKGSDWLCFSDGVHNIWYMLGNQFQTLSYVIDTLWLSALRVRMAVWDWLLKLQRQSNVSHGKIIPRSLIKKLTTAHCRIINKRLLSTYRFVWGKPVTKPCSTRIAGGGMSRSVVDKTMCQG